MALRIVFMGTPEFAVASLEAIIAAGVEVAAVVTVPDKPAGRGQKMQESPVALCAARHGLPTLKPEKLKAPEFLEQLNSYKADLFVVVAFRMLPEAVWNMPPKGTVNLHTSLLPQYRGAAPINWAIINGEEKTGTTVFFIERDIDTGKILSRREEAITPDDTAGTLHDRLMTSGAQHLTEALAAIVEGSYSPQPQPASENLKTAPKIFRNDCRIKWEQELTTLRNFIRGLAPYPAAWTTLLTPKGERLTLKIFAVEAAQPPATLSSSAPTAGTVVTDGRKHLWVAVSNGWLEIKSLQLEGKRRMETEEFLHGLSYQPVFD